MTHPYIRMRIILLWSVALGLGSLIFGWLFEQVSFLDKIDTYLYRHIFEARHFSIMNTLAQPFNYNLFFHVPGLPEDIPTFFYFLLAGVALYLWRYRKKEVWWFLSSVLVGNILVHLITILDAEFVFRTRPFITLHETIDSYAYNAWKGLSSYPSGHVRDIALYCTLISLWVPRLRWPSVVLVLFIMYTRVYQGAHYPSDVIAGALIGVFAAVISWQAVGMMRERVAKRN